jgi:hypothetical protein
MVLWLDIDKNQPKDCVEMTNDELKKYGLVNEHDRTNEHVTTLYDQWMLNYMNSNVWALSDRDNIIKRLHFACYGMICVIIHYFL